MGDFNSLFPNFLTLCLSLKTILTPVAFLLLTSGLIASTISHHREGHAQLHAIGRTIVFIMLIVFLPTWGNQIASDVDDLVKNVMKVDPAKIHDQYQAALELKKSGPGATSWWDKLFSFPSLIESLMSVIFIVLGWLASTIEWWAYIIQTAIVFVGYALSPIFIGMLAFPSMKNIGRNYLLNLLGVLIWPFGWGVAGLITQGMIDFMTDRSFLSAGGFGGAIGYSLQNLMGLAFLGIWIIFSTIAAPVIMQKAIATGGSAAASLLGGAFSAGRVAATAGGMAFAESSGKGIIHAGAMASAAASESLATSSLNGGHGGSSLIGSLAQINNRDQRWGHGKSNQKPKSSIPPNDPSGDKTVASLLDRSQNSKS
jgi:hypothetical protein